MEHSAALKFSPSPPQGFETLRSADEILSRQRETLGLERVPRPPRPEAGEGRRIMPEGRNGPFLFDRLVSVEVEYRSIRLLRTESGEEILERTSLRFQAVESYRRVADQAPVPGDPIERSADRIARFALDRFAGREDPDSEAGLLERANFRNLVLPAVRQGADEAKEILAGLPSEILAVADQVYQLVARLLNVFVESGTAPPASSVGNFTSEFVQSLSLEASVERTHLGPGKGPTPIDVTV